MYHSSNQATIEAWRDGDDKAKTGNIFADGDNLYSYGEHFTLATRVKDLQGNTAYLINGDTYSNSTSRHTRGCISTLKPNFQIPFSALDGAKIPTKPYGLTLIDHQDDVYTTENYTDKDGKPATRQVHHLGQTVFRYRNRYYLSGFDVNESWGNGYYLCQLKQKYFVPGTDPLELLKPDSVRAWEQAGDDVKRQGEWYFVKTNLLTRTLKPFTKHPATRTDYTWSKGGWDKDKDKYIESVRSEHVVNLGYSWAYKGEVVSHCATELRTNDKLIYARGTVKHNPANRGKTHKRLNLGKSWHVIIKNTATGSWESAGNVD